LAGKVTRRRVRREGPWVLEKSWGKGTNPGFGRGRAGKSRSFRKEKNQGTRRRSMIRETRTCGRAIVGRSLERGETLLGKIPAAGGAREGGVSGGGEVPPSLAKYAFIQREKKSLLLGKGKLGSQGKGALEGERG